MSRRLLLLRLLLLPLQSLAQGQPQHAILLFLLFPLLIIVIVAHGIRQAIAVLVGAMHHRLLPLLPLHGRCGNPSGRWPAGCRLGCCCGRHRSCCRGLRRQVRAQGGRGQRPREQLPGWCMLRCCRWGCELEEEGPGVGDGGDGRHPASLHPIPVQPLSQCKALHRGRQQQWKAAGVVRSWELTNPQTRLARAECTHWWAGGAHHSHHCCAPTVPPSMPTHQGPTLGSQAVPLHPSTHHPHGPATPHLLREGDLGRVAPLARQAVLVHQLLVEAAPAVVVVAGDDLTLRRVACGGQPVECWGAQ